MGKRGFSLVEIVTVLAIIGVGLALFYSALFINWFSLEQQICLTDLQMEADRIIDIISLDGKLARLITVSSSGKDVIFTYPVLTPPVGSITYSLTAQGEIVRNDILISSHVDFNNSFFTKTSRALVVNLTLQDIVFGRRLELPVSTQIFPRNLL